MKFRKSLPWFVLLASLFVMCAPLFAADMFVGKWKENVSKSTYNPGPPPKAPGSFTFEGVPNGLKYVGDGVTDKGSKTHEEVTAKFDGKDYPAKMLLDGKPDPNAPDAISVKRIDEYTMEYEYKTKGKVVFRGRAVLSKDGKTQTHTQTALTPDGKTVGTQTVVFERQ